MSRVRLTPSKIPRLNLVEIYHNGEWGTLCDDDRGAINNLYVWAKGEVICRQLGYMNATNVTSSAILGNNSYHDAPVSEKIWLDDILCTGIETDIDECILGIWGRNDCGHHEDILVQCDYCEYIGHTILRLYNSMNSSCQNHCGLSVF